MPIQDILQDTGDDIEQSPRDAPAAATPSREPGEVVERGGTLPSQMPVNRTTVRQLPATVDARNEGSLEDPPEAERMGGDNRVEDPHTTASRAQQRTTEEPDRSRQEEQEAQRRAEETANADEDNSEGIISYIEDEDGYLPGTRPPDFEMPDGAFGAVLDTAGILSLIGGEL